MFETVLQSDLKKMVTVQPLYGNIFSGDNQANKITVELLDNGQPAATLSGTIRGYIILGNNESFATDPGTRSGNRYSVVLPSAAYACVGRISIVIKVGSVTIGACTSYVYRTSTDEVIDPEGVVPDLSALIAAAEACATATTEANRVDINQTKSGNVITVTATRRDGTTVSKTLTEPTVTVTPHTGDFDLTVTDANGSSTTTIPNPNKELADRAHVESISDAKTATGNPAVIEDAVAEIVDGYSVTVLPIQDFHGYDNVWAGGAGGNLFEISTVNGETQTVTVYDVVYTIQTDADGNVTGVKQNGTSSATGTSYCYIGKATLQAGTYTFCTIGGESGVNGLRLGVGNSGNTGAQGTYLAVIREGSPYTVTITEETTYSLSISCATGTSISNAIFQPMIVSGSEVPETFIPWANKCPIVGYDSVDVIRSGRNLFDGVYTEGRLLSATGGVSNNPDHKISKYHIPVNSLTTYTLSSPTLHYRGANPSASGNSFVNVVEYDYNKTFITRPFSEQDASTSRTFTTGANTRFVRFSVGTGAENVQLECGDYVSSYEPYAGQKYTIALSNVAGGTVYGGTVNVNRDGSATLLVEWKYVDLGDYTFIKSSVNTFYTRGISDFKQVTAMGSYFCGLFVCDSYLYTNKYYNQLQHGETTLYHTGTETNNLHIKDDRCLEMTAEEFKAYITGTKLAYLLETPLSYSLTAPQVQTLFGYNHINTSGNRVSVDYRRLKLTTLDALVDSLHSAWKFTYPGYIYDPTTHIETLTPAVLTCDYSAGSVPFKNMVIGIEPTQEIVGWQDPWVGGAGKNLLNPDYLEPINNATKEETSANAYYVTTTTDAAYAGVATRNHTEILEIGKTYTVRFYAHIETPRPSGNATSCGFRKYASGTFYGTRASITQNGYYTATATITEESYLTLCVTGSTAEQGAITFSSIIMVEGEVSDLPVFEPYAHPEPISGYDVLKITRTRTGYSAQNFYFPIPDEVGTIYGGSLAVDRYGNATLTVTKKLIDVQTYSGISYGSTSGGYYYIQDSSIKKNSGASVTPDLISNHYKAFPTNVLASTDYGIFVSPTYNRILIKDAGVTSEAELRARGTVIVYELAEPIVYHYAVNQIVNVDGNPEYTNYSMGGLQIIYGQDSYLAAKALFDSLTNASGVSF